MLESISSEVYIQKNCPLCSSNNVIPVKHEKNNFTHQISPLVNSFHKAWVTLLECKECGFGFCKEMPSHPDFFNQRYSSEFDPNIEGDNNFKHTILDELFYTLQKYQKEKGKILDIGSFAGVFIRDAQKRGYQAEGVEVNPNMARYTIEKLKLKVFNGKIQEFDGKENSFDIITLIDVLEHLPDPKIILEKCQHLLRPGGILIIKVPNYPAQKLKQKVANILGISAYGIFSDFGHINQFSQRSLNHVCEHLGFKNLECAIVSSEMWAPTSLKNRTKNIGRVLMYNLMKLICKTTNLNYGFNIIHFSQKN